MICRILILLFVIGSLPLSAQVKLRTENVNMSIGSPNTLLISVNRPYDEIEDINWEQVIEDIPMFRIIQDGPWEKGEKQNWLKKVEFSVYDTGYYQIQPLSIIAIKNSKRDSLRSNLLPLKIYYEGYQGEGFDIKGIIKEGYRLSDFLIPLLVLLGIAALIFLVRKYVHRAKDSDEEIVPEVIIPAHVLALGELEKLESEKLWITGDYKEHQTRLSMLVRRYLEGAFKVPAPESTTREILRSLSSVRLQPKQVSLLTELLQLADMVKYAKADPPEESHVRLMNEAKVFIEETISLSIDHPKEEEE